MKLFGRKAGREASRPALSRSPVGVAGAVPGDWPRSYEAQVRAGYLGNAIALRAVRLVAESLGGAALVASDARLLALVTARSAPDMAGGPPLLETVAAQLLLHGNAFVQVLARADGGPAALYRQGAVFVMNASVLARIRKFKTSDGAFVWQPSLSAKVPATLLGYPVIEAEDMPDIAADAPSIAFGNFRLGYLIAERTETSILRDPYTNKPFTSFYATKRIGGCVSNSEAIKLMRFSEA